MYYWTCSKYRNGVKYFISGTDEAGYPIETKDESKAYHFKDFGNAMSFFNLGYSVMKHYC
jgi:hypothetical protein